MSTHKKCGPTAGKALEKSGRHKKSGPTAGKALEKRGRHIETKYLFLHVVQSHALFVLSIEFKGWVATLSILSRIL